MRARCQMVVILSPDILSELRLTVDEYLLADLPEGRRYELVEGVIEMSPVPEFLHDLIVARFHDAFSEYRKRRPDLVEHVSQRAAVTVVARGTAREPDLAVYPPHEAGAGGKLSWKERVPTLVIEVISPGHERRDYEAKRRDYWEAGVGEYWIANPRQITLTVLTRGAADWKEEILGQDSQLLSKSFPGLSISVAESLTT